MIIAKRDERPHFEYAIRSIAAELIFHYNSVLTVHQEHALFEFDLRDFVSEDRKRVETEYALPIVVDRYLDLYRRLLEWNDSPQRHKGHKEEEKTGP